MLNNIENNSCKNLYYLLKFVFIVYFSTLIYGKLAYGSDTAVILRHLDFQKDSDRVGAFSFKDDNDNTYHIKEFEGQIVVFYFWASWCMSCVDELKLLNELKTKLLYENILDIEIIPISLDFKKHDSLYSVYKKSEISNLGLFLDKEKSAIKALGVFNVPFTVILDKNLKIITKTKHSIAWTDSDIVKQLIDLRGGKIEKYK